MQVNIISIFPSFVLICLFTNVQFVLAGFFWHVTDIHMDQNYSRTASPDKMCHGKESNGTDAGQYGNYRCDSPLFLVNVSMRDMQSIHSNPDFVIWTGDNLPHTRDPDPGWDTIFAGIRNITFMLKSTFPNTPIFPSIGNHDVYPPNKMPVRAEDIYNKYLEIGGWKSLLNEESVSTFKKGGYFSQTVKQGLRVISLNTILWYTPNNETSSEKDPSDQVQWLEKVLMNSNKSNEKVYIIGHVPPGYYNRVQPGKESTPLFHPQYHSAYLQILNKYFKVISGQFYGHLHMDFFQLFQFDTGSFKSSSLLSSSITPWFYPDKYGVVVPVNPSVRLVEFSNSNFSLLDFNQYYLNLTIANNITENNKESGPIFEHLYGFCETYNVPDLSTQSLVKVFEMLKNNQSVYSTFFHYLTAGKDISNCDKDCKVAQLCSMSSTSIDEYNKCMSSSDDPSHSKASPKLIAVYVLVPLALVMCIGFLAFRRYRRNRLMSDYEAYSY